MVRALRDARGRSVLAGGAQSDVKARGAEVTLSLDVQVQHMAEQALAQAVASTGAKGASAVVLDVHSAEILALAMAPTFNPQDERGVPPEWRRNRALTDMIEPGSTLKPLVVAAALDTGAVTPHTKLFCENGRLALKGHTISDTSPHGSLTLTEIIAKSSNIGMAKVSMLMGKQNLEFALRRLGFGKKTGVEFPGESPGMLRPASSWSELEAATIAFGQGMAVNLVQLAAAYRVLAADGVYREPRLLRQIRRADGSILPLPPPAQRPVLSMDAARRVTRMLEAAITPVGGTGRLAAVGGYRVAGKTGTAQKADVLRRGYSDDKYVAMFAGYLPAEAPRVVIVVAVDEPTTNHYGGVVAAPVFAQIGAAAMQRLGVLASAGVPQPPYAPAEAEAMRAEPPALAGVTAPAAPRALPAPPQTFVGPPLLPDGGVPSFLGLSARQAVQAFVQHHLAGELMLTGTGAVVHQDPAPGVSLAQQHNLQLMLAGP
jgi:cell division protein FtsI (penicillin-binding protein 3)